MLQFNISGKLPKSFAKDKVHTIVSRDTYYGLHRSFSNKSTLVFFALQKDADRFSRWMNTQAARGLYLDRTIGMQQTVGIVDGTERIHSRIVSVPLMDVQKLCLIQFLDLWLVYNVPRHLSRDPRDINELDCYEFATSEPPNRELTNLLLEELLSR